MISTGASRELISKACRGDIC